MAQHGWAALSKMSATSLPRLGSVLAGWAAGPGVTRSTRRAVRVAGRPARRAEAALCRRVSRRPVRGRARICTAADSPSLIASRAPRSGRRGSTLCSVRSGYCSGRARRSSPPVAIPPPASGGRAGTVSVRAPGQAASTARSTRPGGTTPGTHRLMVSPASVATNSKPRCGWPPSARRHAGRSSATRLVQKVAAPWGSTSGGASTCTMRAPSARRRAWRRRMTVTETIAATATPARAGPAVTPRCRCQGAEVVEQPGGLGARVGEVAGRGARRIAGGRTGVGCGVGTLTRVGLL